MMQEGQLARSCLLLAVLATIQTAVSGLTMSACFGGANKTLDVDCGPGHMLHITKTFYGFSPTGLCGLASADDECTMAENVHYSCVGQQSCSINLPTGRYGVNVPACGQRSNYFQVEYTCVPVSSVTDICQSKDQLTAQSGYIMTPRYPANYHRQGECSTTILVHPSQKLRLHIIDMDLQSQTRLDCSDLLYFNDKLRSITLCGARSNNSYNMHSNFLHVELNSKSGGLSKGFWLYYEAWPPLPTSLLPPTKPPTEDQGEQTTEPVTTRPKGGNSVILTTIKPAGDTKSTVPLYRNSSRPSGEQLPFAAIAGGVIGTLSLILIILLLLLLIKWYKERRYNKVEKVLEIRNPAFRSSTDFQETQQQQQTYPGYSNNYPAHGPTHTPHTHVPNNSGYYC